MYSDSDEIPDLSKIDLKKEKTKIVLFKQKVFHYKFNLLLESHDWYGSKTCKFKDLESITNLRNIKTKKYDWWRMDTVFKKDKFINIGLRINSFKNFKERKRKNFD